MNVARTQDGGQNGHRIVRLTASNVKRLRAVEISPDGDLVVIGGRNEQGKSSILDSIEMALGGKRTHCRKPVRDGEEKGEVVCDLGDLVVRRTFTAAGGGSLYVENKDGAQYRSPQAILDKMVGELTLDPLEFARMRPEQQAEAVRRIAGLDLADLDAERAEAYEQRTLTNRDAKKAQLRAEQMPKHADAPEAEVDPAELLEELESARASNENNQRLRNEAKRLDAQLVDVSSNAVTAHRHVEECERALAEAKRVLSAASERVNEVRKEAENAVARADAVDGGDVDLDPIRQRIAEVEHQNRLVRENAARAEAEAEHKRIVEESANLTAQIEAIDRQRQERIAAAPMPVDGLGFDEVGLTFGGVPFEQCSQAQKLRVSVAMAIAGNPRLRVLLIRDASLLDDAHMQLMAELAAEHGVQLWMERVEADAHCSVVIEDGAVRGATGSEESE